MRNIHIRLIAALLFLVALYLPIRPVLGHEMVNTGALLAQSGQVRTARQVASGSAAPVSATATATTTEETATTSLSLSPTVPAITQTPGTNLCGNGRDAEFLQCLSTGRTNQTNACRSLQARQNYAYFTCMCETFGVIVTCYDTCPDQGSNYLLEDGQRSSYCSAADLTRPKSTTRKPSSVSRTFANGGNGGSNDPTYTNTLSRVTNRANLVDAPSNDGGESGNRAGAVENAIAAAVGGAAVVAAAVLG